MDDELRIKQQRLADFLDRHQLDGVLLTLRSNFAWITCGRDNHIANNTPVGVASILATRDGKRICLANAIEAPRMKLEELAGKDIETIEFPWWDGAAGERIIRDVIAGKTIATDCDAFAGAPLRGLPAEFNALRWSLTPSEITHYRDGGKRAATAMERACRALKPGITEHDAAGILDHEIHSAGLNPLVTLVSSDDRLPKFRHPIPTDHRIREHVMLVTCAEFAGLISCLTRFVRFGKPTDEQRKKQAIANIDAAVNLATKPGRTLGEIFDDLRQAYAREGFDGEWKNHHQGGSCGYQPRDVVATPGSSVRVVENQAFAWNPSIVGAKSEDTVLVGEKGIEVLTAHSNDWPTVTGRSPFGELRRADVLSV